MKRSPIKRRSAKRRVRRICRNMIEFAMGRQEPVLLFCALSTGWESDPPMTHTGQHQESINVDRGGSDRMVTISWD